MRAVVQRVLGASVSVAGTIRGSIGRGLLVYLGVARGDGKEDAEYLAEKTANLRIFEDGQGKMNLSLKDLLAQGGRAGVLAVSQFTLLADARKGRRPYYGGAAEAAEAEPLYQYFIERIRGRGLVCESGIFQARMEVACTNEGPVTILLDSRAAG
ncbi:MAG: D-tyrosyl-tRNA(Tyr) deacylase [Treponema sp.]|jgi:D-tyrosyl-tRNA(Tyr) deacylase|nr:D-tyrosyl-tRNA(Tyr) deacylase [Treponema sp.]